MLNKLTAWMLIPLLLLVIACGNSSSKTNATSSNSNSFKNKLLPAKNARDMAINSTDNSVYISNGNEILHYDFNGKLLDTITVGYYLGGIALNSDNSQLAVADYVRTEEEVWVYLIDTKSHEISIVSFIAFSDLEAGTHFVTYTNKDELLITSNAVGGASSYFPLRHINVKTGEIIFQFNVNQGAVLSPIDGGTKFLFVEPNSTGGPYGIYNPDTHVVEYSAQADDFIYNIAVDRHNTNIAIPLGDELKIFDLSGNLIFKLPTEYYFGNLYGLFSSVVYNPVSDYLYITWGDSSSISVFNASNYEFIRNINIHNNMEWIGPWNLTNGNIKITPDGKRGLVVVDDGVYIFDTETPADSNIGLDISSGTNNTAESNGDKTFLPAKNSRDMVYNPTDNSLYITNKTEILQYNVITGKLLNTIKLGRDLIGIDINADYTQLAVAEGEMTNKTCTVYIIDTITHTIKERQLLAGESESGLYDVAFTADNNLLISSYFSGSGFVPFRHLDLKTGQILKIKEVSEEVYFSSNPNKSLIALIEAGISSGPIAIYNPSTQIFDLEKETMTFLFTVSFDRTSSYLATCDYTGFYTYDTLGNKILFTPKTNLYGDVAGLAYSPTEDKLYISWYKSFKVSIFNSLTHELIKDIDIGYDFDWHGNNSMAGGQLNISPDGKIGFIQVRNGIKVLNLE